MHKTAFLGGLLKKRKEGQQQAALAGFDTAVQGISHDLAMPKDTIEGWRKEVTPGNSADGYNQFSDKFNPWLQSDEGKKWNEEQGKIYIANQSKTANIQEAGMQNFWDGFEKKALMEAQGLTKYDKDKHDKAMGRGALQGTAVGTGLGAAGGSLTREFRTGKRLTGRGAAAGAVIGGVGGMLRGSEKEKKRQIEAGESRPVKGFVDAFTRTKD